MPFTPPTSSIDGIFAVQTLATAEADLIGRDDTTITKAMARLAESRIPTMPLSDVGGTNQGFISPMTWGVENNVIERFAGAGVPARHQSSLMHSENTTRVTVTLN